MLEKVANGLSAEVDSELNVSKFGQLHILGKFWGMFKPLLGSPTSTI
jgi:hypothetical protein